MQNQLAGNEGEMMENNRSSLSTKMFEYNVWANKRVIELCGNLDQDQLGIEVEGAYGRIYPTLVHLVSAEGGYVGRLAGSPLWPDDLDWEQMSMADLVKRAHESGTKLVEIAHQVDIDLQHEVEHEGRPFYFFNWTVLLQAIYHGIEHRTQIKILLTQLGVDHPDLSSWDYMEHLQGW